MKRFAIELLKDKRSGEKIMRAIISSIIIWVFCFNLRGLFLLGIIDNLKLAIRHPLLKYEDKVRFKVGPTFYDFVSFIKNNTPEESTILLPPFPDAFPWPQTGNVAYMRYFLYPRKLINGKQFEPGLDLKKEGVDYILIAWGEGTVESNGFSHGWPKFDIPARKIIYLSGVPKKIRQDYYIYNEHQGLQSWGLIEL